MCNKKQPYTLALIGCGRVAEKHLKAIRYQENKGRLRLIAAVDSKKERASALVRKFYTASDNIAVFQDSKELYLKEKPDIVAITTPSFTHKDLALEAIAASAHVLLEKPMAMSLADAREIAEAAEVVGTVLALGHIYRYLPCMKALADDIAAGKYGKVLYATVSVRWGHDQSYYEQAPWRGTYAGEGGVVMNQSVHALDLMRWLMGKENVELADCSAIASTQSHVMEAEDLSLAHFTFQDKTYLQYEGTTSSDPMHKQAEFFICCEQADICAGLRGKSLSFSVLSSEGEKRWAYLWPYLKELINAEGLCGLQTIVNPHTVIYGDLLKAIAEGRKPLASLDSGLSSLEMVEAIYRAAGINGGNNENSRFNL